MKGVVVWFTGLPASGKTALAEAVKQRLTIQGTPCCILDGDKVRGALRPPMGYEPKDRENFYSTLGGLAAILAQEGLVVLVSATAPMQRHRDHGRRAAPAFVEVFVDTPLAECEKRDPKGLYKKARKGDLRFFPGVGAKYEPPANPDVLARNGVGDEAIAAVGYAIATNRRES